MRAHRRMLYCTLVAAVATSSLSITAHAQWSGYSGPANIMAESATQNMFGLTRLRTMQDAFALDQRRRKNRAVSGGPGQPANTPIAPTHARAATDNWKIDNDPAVARQVRDKIIGEIAHSTGAAAAAHADQLYGNVQVTFARMVGPYGLRSDNLVDVMTAYAVVMWMSVNQQTALPSATQVQGVRRQMQSVFESGSMTSARGAQRQILADTTMYLTCLAVSTREQAIAQSKPELLATLAAQTEQSTANLGLDLRNLALTDSGFAPLQNRSHR